MQVSWIDADHVSALAEALRHAPVAKQVPPAESALLSTPDWDEPDPVPLEPETIAPPVAEPQEPVAELNDGHSADFRSKLKAIRERAIQAGLISTSPASAAAVLERSIPQPLSVPEVIESTLPPFEPLAGAVADRVAAFAIWARPALGSADLFIVGDQGDLIWGQSQQSGLVLSAILARSASSRMSALAACESADTLQQVLSTGVHLTAIPCATRLGTMHVAVTGHAALPERHIPALREALIAAMEAEA